MRLLTFVSLLCAFVLSAVSAQAYRLQFKDAKGDTHTFNVAMNTKGTMEVAGLSLPLSSTTTLTTVESVLAVENGKSTISDVEKNGKTTMVVSGMPGDDAPEQIAQPMPDFTMTYDRTPQGKVSNFKMTGGMASVLGTQFSGVNSQTEYPGQGLEFPAKDLAFGDTWTGKTTMSLFAGSQLDVTANYTLAGPKTVNGKTYLVVECDMSGKMTPATMNAPGSTSGQQMSFGMTMTGSSKTLFDEDAGQLVSTTYTMHVDMDIAALGADAGAGKVIMDVDGTITEK